MCFNGDKAKTFFGYHFSHAVLLSVLAFFPNLVWEYAQCSRFFIHKSVAPTYLAMLFAIVGDVGLTWIINLLISLKRKDYFWSLGKWKKSDFYLILLSSLILAALIEIRAIKTGRWSYTPGTPLLPWTEISIVPLAQLVILVPFVLWIHSRLMRLVFHQ